jgi:hypothetical protein
MSISKKIAGVVLSTAVVVGVGVTSTGTAEAATDRRACVTAGEYGSIYRGMSQTRMFQILDGRGVLLDTIVNSTEDEWVEDGWWDYQWVDGYYDEYGDWVDGYEEEVWVDDGYWIEGYSVKDTVRSYKKCPGFGSGRIGINLDNYSGGREYMHVYTKVRSNPWGLVDWLYGAFERPVAARGGSGEYKVIPRG